MGLDICATQCYIFNNTVLHIFIDRIQTAKEELNHARERKKQIQQSARRQDFLLFYADNSAFAKERDRISSNRKRF